MSIILNGTGESLRVVLASSPSSTQPALTASWADQGATSGDSSMLANGTTAVTLVAAPAASVSRWVGGVSIYNQDSSAATVTVQKLVSGTPYTLFRARILPGCHIFYDNAQGWRVVDANGCLLTTSNQSPAVPIQGTRNQLLNGDLRINQPVFAGGSLAANSYGYDCWRTFSATGSISLAVGGASITLGGTVGQVIEAPDDASAVVTVSVSNPSGPITVALQPDGVTAGVSGVIPSGSGQQSVTLTVPGTITGNVFVLLTVSGSVTIDGPSKRSGIQLELGSFATAFERRTFNTELISCMRFYEKTYDYASAPGSVSTSGMLNRRDVFSTASGHTLTFDYSYKVPKRSTPAITCYSPATGASGSARDYLAAADITASPANTGEKATAVGVGTASASGYNVGMHIIVDSRI